MLLSSPLTRSLAAGSVLTGAILGLGAFHGAAAATPEASAGLSWLAAEVDANDGVFTYDSGFGDFTDFGLSIDAVLALALGGGHTDSVGDAMDAIDDDLQSYVSHPDFGSGAGVSAGPIAKTLVAEQVTGRGTTVDGFNLEVELRDTLQPATDARRVGRFDADHGDFSNGVTQALGVIALARTTGGVPAPAVAFLLAQQCPGGGFRTSYDVTDPDTFEVDEAASTHGCTANTDADLDGTSFALEALLAVRNDPGVPAAIAGAIAYLESHPAPNANSAGLAGQALRAAGETGAADAAATQVLALQLPAPGPDAGAIALNAAAKAAAAGSTIAEANLPQFWRATAQGLLALGLGSYGPVVAPPATTTSSTTTSTTAASSSTTSTTAASSTTSTTKATTTSTIPKTGSSTGTEARLALLLIGAGVVATGQSLLRDRRTS